MALILEEMKAKGSTLQALHEEYLADNPNGLSYSRFCTHFREYKKKLKRSLRVIHYAGEKVFVDYAGPTITIQLSQSNQRKAQILLGFLVLQITSMRKQPGLKRERTGLILM
jgi:transposase